MEQRPLRLGDIVDDYCPRERRITNHAIVALVGEDIRQTPMHHLRRRACLQRTAKCRAAGAAPGRTASRLGKPVRHGPPVPPMAVAAGELVAAIGGRSDGRRWRRRRRIRRRRPTRRAAGARRRRRRRRWLAGASAADTRDAATDRRRPAVPPARSPNSPCISARRAADARSGRGTVERRRATASPNGVGNANGNATATSPATAAARSPPGHGAGHGGGRPGRHRGSSNKRSR